MPKYMIEREIPNAGKLIPKELRPISQKSLANRISAVRSVIGPTTAEG